VAAMSRDWGQGAAPGRHRRAGRRPQSGSQLALSAEESARTSDHAEMIAWCRRAAARAPGQVHDARARGSCRYW